MVAQQRSITIPAWVAVALAACGDDPMPPVACASIPQQTVTVGEQVLVEPCFEDPEMGALTLAVVSSDPEVATAEVVGDKVRVGAVSPGTATITVTATDPDMLVGELNIEVLVPNRPPALLGEPPAARMHTGDAPVKLVLSEYFADPDGQQLTYGAMSSDTAVASVALSADTLAVTGVSVGTATVTVTATDPGGLSATARMDVTVSTNRPPVVDREEFRLYTPKVMWSHWQSSFFSMSGVFSDPDDDELRFSIKSSDTAVATASIGVDGAGGILRARDPGVATVSVTATDPDGLSATAEITVNVFARGQLPFRDAFNSDESLANWALWSEATAAFGDGMVHVAHPNIRGRLYAGLLRPLDALNWWVHARMGNVTEGSWAQLMFGLWARERPYSALAFQVGADPGHHWTGEDTNWRLIGKPVGGSAWVVIASGESEAVGGVGELVDVTLSHIGSRFKVSIGASEVFSSTGLGSGRQIRATHLTLGLWPAPNTQGTVKTAVFDRVEVNGRFAGYEDRGLRLGRKLTGDEAEYWTEVGGSSAVAPRIDEVRSRPNGADGPPRPRTRLERPPAFLTPDDEDPLVLLKPAKRKV